MLKNSNLKIKFKNFNVSKFVPEVSCTHTRMKVLIVRKLPILCKIVHRMMFKNVCFLTHFSIISIAFVFVFIKRPFVNFPSVWIIYSQYENNY